VAAGGGRCGRPRPRPRPRRLGIAHYQVAAPPSTSIVSPDSRYNLQATPMAAACCPAAARKPHAGGAAALAWPAAPLLLVSALLLACSAPGAHSALLTVTQADGRHMEGCQRCAGLTCVEGGVQQQGGAWDNPFISSSHHAACASAALSCGRWPGAARCAVSAQHCLCAAACSGRPTRMGWFPPSSRVRAQHAPC
jgi:hypothetical protein